MTRWKVLDSVEVLKSRVFRLRSDKCELPDGRVMPSYYVMEFPDWVNIIPVTEDRQLVMIEQYRHAGEEMFLEIPGGSTHAKGEDPRVAGERELREETGYQAAEWVYCGYHYPNPALNNNKMHTYLALGCRKVGEQELDPFEDLTVKLMPVKEALELWADGKIRHSLISTSIGLSLKFLKERGLA
jgi:8-oxo-dGTP pyrophosphatase MutT (NUDIX family)